MRTEEKKLLDWQEKIEALKTKTTELKTRTEMYEKQLAEFGIKNPDKAQAKIDSLQSELEEQIAKIAGMIEEITTEFNLEDEE